MLAGTSDVTRAAAQRPNPRPRHGIGAAAALAVAALCALLVVVPTAAAVHVWRTAAVHATAPTDALVVLGAAQYDGVPSPVLANRLDHALHLYRDGAAPRIITVGGKQPGDAFTEAAAGQLWLTDRGVPRSDIKVVPSGTDTLTSMQAVAQLMADNGWHSVTIVTDPAHAARTKAIADSLGLQAQANPTSSGAGSQITTEYGVRETAGYLYHLLIQQWTVARIVDPGRS